MRANGPDTEAATDRISVLFAMRRDGAFYESRVPEATAA